MADPRHLILPEGIVSTGWPAIRDTSEQVGIRYDPWQVELNRAMAAKDAAGLYAASIVVMSIPRQVGKTFDVGGFTFADSIINPGTVTAWTAHRFKVAREAFEELRGLASHPKMAPHVDKDAITTAAGNETIPFRNGSRILFAARERGSLRGFTKIRRLVLDEAQILSENAMADLAPTQNHAWNPQTVLMGTPPKPGDPAEVFNAFRSEALAGDGDGDVLYIEYGADPDLDWTAGEDILWAAVDQANPSFPHRTPKRAIRRLRKLLVTDENFAREGLGIWDTTSAHHIVDLGAWALLEDVPTERPERIALAVAASSNRQWTYIGLAGERSDGRVHLQVIKSNRGTGWVLDELVRLKREYRPVNIVMATDDPAGSLLPDIEKRKGLKVDVLQSREVARAAGMFVDGVKEEGLSHGGGRLLDISVEHARKRRLGESFVFAGPKDESTDIAPLKAVTAALYALRSSRKKTGGSETRRAVVM